MIYVLIVAVVAGFTLAPAAQRLVSPSRGALDAGAVESYIGTALALAFMLTVLGGAVYAIIS